MSDTLSERLLALEQRLDHAQAQLDIQQLRATYCHLLDEMRWDEFVDLFTEDGYFEGLDVARGRAGIYRFFSEDVPKLAQRFWHFCTNGQCQIDGERATGRISMEYIAVIDGISYVSAGHYDDTFRRVDGRWKFESRRITFYFYSPLHEGFTGQPPRRATH